MATGTLALAVATFVLARGTSKLAVSATEEAQASRVANELSRDSVDLARRSLSGAIRPVLVDVLRDSVEKATVRFDDGSVDAVFAGSIQVRGTDEYLLCSMSLRNVGAGAAMIRGIGLVDPPWSGNASRMVVPPGETTRFAFTIPKDRPELQAGIRRIVAGDFVFQVLYTDVDGQQATITRAFAYRFEGRGYRVRQIALLRPGEDEPFAMSGPADA